MYRHLFGGGYLPGMVRPGSATRSIASQCAYRHVPRQGLAVITDLCGHLHRTKAVLPLQGAEKGPNVSTTEKPERVDHMELHRLNEQARLLKLARRYETRPDPREPGGYIVRDPDLESPLEYVDAARRCTCPMYGRWDRCGHVAIVQLRHG